MGNWYLEVGRMAMYMAFPVGLFHYFNQPEYFEKFVIEKKRLMYPPEDHSHLNEAEELIRSVKVKRDQKIMEKIEESERLRVASLK